MKCQLPRTGFTGETDFTAVPYSATNNGLPNNRVCSQGTGQTGIVVVRYSETNNCLPIFLMFCTLIRHTV
jgi:hypothetical protein